MEARKAQPSAVGVETHPNLYTELSAQTDPSSLQPKPLSLLHLSLLSQVVPQRIIISPGVTNDHSLCDKRLLRLVSHLHRIHVSLFFLSCTCTQKSFITCEPTPSSSPAQKSMQELFFHFAKLLDKRKWGSPLTNSISFQERSPCQARQGSSFRAWDSAEKAEVAGSHPREQR